ncbi:phosphatidate cytidylyltransferase [Diaphorobacter ruginosibacter]|uniref:Phosphatidate cytidylyltransferase n=1 Tax=Diaphorobacter ruginosibacter TaxID=1715720 RepID=A0A7G9RK19_9BURK|nr:phosphatidate cytidylyltransferase [Diaphorobacter ruginosibacter]QNN55944.1 phosphatidate cytidylyltransferase [Diaphorobacter ruginosibacter]
MLKQRVITALVLLAILLPALFHANTVPFTIVLLVLVAAGAWEWGRLNGLGGTGAVATGAVCLAMCGASWQFGWIQAPLASLWTLAGACWVLGGAFLLRGGVAGWPKIARSVRLVGGVLALWVTWLAVVQARQVGVNYLLSILALVWAADIFAYFAGRAFGLKFTRNKLAPAISPGKSWEGVWGGMAGVAVLAIVWVALDASSQATVASFYSRLAAKGYWLLLLGVVFMAAMSVVGDLVESLVKRSAGMKDSSNLLPGHGGVLDRIDALLPTLPLAMMLTHFAAA